MRGVCLKPLLGGIIRESIYIMCSGILRLFLNIQVSLCGIVLLDSIKVSMCGVILLNIEISLRSVVSWSDGRHGCFLASLLQRRETKRVRKYIAIRWRKEDGQGKGKRNDGAAASMNYIHT